MAAVRLRILAVVVVAIVHKLDAAARFAAGRIPASGDVRRGTETSTGENAVGADAI
jgi:hypothetical protein